MTIKTTTVHTLVFSVEAFWHEEGGMGTEQWGQTVSEMAEAIRMLEMARLCNPKQDWVVVIRAKTVTSETR
jgi:hypothetical protein